MIRNFTGVWAQLARNWQQFSRSSIQVRSNTYRGSGKVWLKTHDDTMNVQSHTSCWWSLLHLTPPRFWCHVLEIPVTQHSYLCQQHIMIRYLRVCSTLHWLPVELWTPVIICFSVLKTSILFIFCITCRFYSCPLRVEFSWTWPSICFLTCLLQILPKDRTIVWRLYYIAWFTAKQRLRFARDLEALYKFVLYLFIYLILKSYLKYKIDRDRNTAQDTDKKTHRPKHVTLTRCSWNTPSKNNAIYITTCKPSMYCVV